MADAGVSESDRCIRKKRQRTDRTPRPGGLRTGLASARASWSAVSPLPLSPKLLGPIVYIPPDLFCCGDEPSPPLRKLFLGPAAGISPGLGFAVAGQEEIVVGNRFFDELLQQEQFGAVNDRMDALLEGLHRSEGLKGIAEQDHRRVAALGHRHGLQGLQSEVLADSVSGKQFFEDYYLIANLAEANEEVPMGRRRMDFVAQFGEGGFGGVEPFRG